MKKHFFFKSKPYNKILVRSKGTCGNAKENKPKAMKINQECRILTSLYF